MFRGFQSPRHQKERERERKKRCMCCLFTPSVHTTQIAQIQFSQAAITLDGMSLCLCILQNCQHDGKKTFGRKYKRILLECGVGTVTLIKTLFGFIRQNLMLNRNYNGKSALPQYLFFCNKLIVEGRMMHRDV